MNEEKEGKGLKSALDLAMERFGDDRKNEVPLTDEQKRRIAEIEQETKARIAEIEIVTGQEAAAAGESGDGEKKNSLEERMRSEIGKARERAEVKKERVRRGES